MKHNTKKKNTNLKSLKNKTQKRFLFNPENPKKSFDVYIDKNPKDTINIKYVKKPSNRTRKLKNYLP